MPEAYSNLIGDLTFVRSSQTSALRGTRPLWSGFKTTTWFMINKYKEKFVLLQSIGLIIIKNRKTKLVAYTCRYSSGYLANPWY